MLTNCSFFNYIDYLSLVYPLQLINLQAQGSLQNLKVYKKNAANIKQDLIIFCILTSNVYF